ncbi:MAG: cyclopropane-fatty-acyl-phospholipid synthase family protein [Actinomycetota bacterium]
MTVASLISGIVGADLPIAVRGWDGSSLGPANAVATVEIRSPDALRRILFAPGELGFARAYVAGDIEVTGDLVAAIGLREVITDVKVRPAHVLEALRLLGLRRLSPISPPAEEVRLRGRLHSFSRDAEAVSHHYDVSNRYYELVLGPSMVYTCALFDRDDATLEEAQEAKLDLVARKLALQPGMRVLDIGCGWGSLAIHMASRYNVRVVAVTIAAQQVERAQKRVAEAGLAHLVEVRLGDYREVDDGPYDAVSAIGILEHVGTDLPAYPATVHRLLRPRGRFVHHAITRPAHRKPRTDGRTFLDRYVFPDAELHEIGSIVTAMQDAGLEAWHMETLREHYVKTLGYWLKNMETNWAECVAEIGLARAKIWKFFMAAGAQGFGANRIQIQQILAVKPDGGRSGMPPHADWTR